MSGAEFSLPGEVVGEVEVALKQKYYLFIESRLTIKKNIEPWRYIVK